MSNPIKSNKYETLCNQRGFSLIELMVGLTIGLVMSLVVFKALTSNEGNKRTTTSVNDINQSGNYALYQLDKLIRSAGSGFTGGASAAFGSASFTYGCQINAALSNTQLLPKLTKLPFPFDGIDGNIRMAPVIIYDGGAAGSDVLLIMAGNSGLSEMPTYFSALAGTASLNLLNQSAIRAGDKLLVVNKPATTVSPCLLQEVDKNFVPVNGGAVVPLSGDYYAATINQLSLANYTSSAVVINLGSSPGLIMLGVGNNNSLMKYDLLQPQQTNTANNNLNPGAMSDGIYQMQALYGVDDDNNAATTSLTWMAPTGNYSAASLLAGTTDAATRLMTIKAIRIGLVMRTSLAEREAVSAATLNLFNDLSQGAQNLSINVTLSPQTFRYLSYEAIIPIRNSL